MALNSITKKEILDQLEKTHKFEIPKNLIDNEIKAIPNNPKTKMKDDRKYQSSRKKNKIGFNFK